MKTPMTVNTTTASSWSALDTIVNTEPAPKKLRRSYVDSLRREKAKKIKKGLTPEKAIALALSDTRAKTPLALTLQMVIHCQGLGATVADVRWELRAHGHRLTVAEVRGLVDTLTGLGCVEVIEPRRLGRPGSLQHRVIFTALDTIDFSDFE
jgi:hypothetical protein